MLQGIEIVNFESHEHTVIEDLSDRLNLIYGESDSGKSAIVRALRLLAYNEFDPASVRIGSKNCIVKGWTEKGYVKVTRGKENLWEVGKAGEKVRYFEKIGNKVLPEVTEVLGLAMVRLGDIDIPANIMDQAEAHFMLNELAGKEASGSIRAQVVDEISGLSGIEGLIKEVSLDRHRAGREVKEQEDKAQELRGKMHAPATLDAEEALLSQVEGLLKVHEDNGLAIEALAAVLAEFQTVSEEMKERDAELRGLPNSRMVSAVIDRAAKAAQKVNLMTALDGEWQGERSSCLSLELMVSKIPDTAGAHELLVDAAQKAQRANRLSGLLSDIAMVRALLVNNQDEMKKFGDLDAAAKATEDADDALSIAGQMRGLVGDWEDAVRAFDFSKREAEELPDFMAAKAALELAKQTTGIIAALRDFQAEIQDEHEARECLVREQKLAESSVVAVQKELQELMMSVTVCPLSGEPVSASCFPGMRFPVEE